MVRSVLQHHHARNGWRGAHFIASGAPTGSAQSHSRRSDRSICVECVDVGCHSGIERRSACRIMDGADVRANLGVRRAHAEYKHVGA